MAQGPWPAARGDLMILLIDNYDSFAYNLARYLTRLGQAITVRRNDQIDPAQVRELNPAIIVFSPGPGTPRQAGIGIELVSQCRDTVPMLGVCLGHQTIVEAFGGKVVRAARPMHGRASTITHDGKGVFAGIANPTVVGRYHSLVATRDGLPGCFEISATTAHGTIMAIRHVGLPIVGLQFHPESILTVDGYMILANFLRLTGQSVTTVRESAEYVSRQPVAATVPRPAQPVTF